MSRILANFTLTADQQAQFEALAADQKPSQVVKQALLEKLEGSTTNAELQAPGTTILNALKSWEKQLGPKEARKYQAYFNLIRQNVGNVDTLILREEKQKKQQKQKS